MGANLHAPADRDTPDYPARPEWYFLFLFQTLKLFTGPLELVGSVVLPGLAVLALILVPFIDRAQMVKVRRRSLAIGVVILALLGWSGLTAAAINQTFTYTFADDSLLSGAARMPRNCIL